MSSTGSKSTVSSAVSAPVYPGNSVSPAAISSFSSPAACFPRPGCSNEEDLEVEMASQDLAQAALTGVSKSASTPEVTRVKNMSCSERVMADKIKKQKKENTWHEFVRGNLIVKQGVIDKKRTEIDQGFFARRRMLLLTEGPHLFYGEPDSMQFKGEIPFTAELRTEVKNFSTFFVHTVRPFKLPGRTYYLFDPLRNAHMWAESIEKVKERYFKKTPSSSPASTPVKEKKKASFSPSWKLRKMKLDTEGESESREGKKQKEQREQEKVEKKKEKELGKPK